MLKKINLGTRSSALALWQANQVKQRLAAFGYDCQLIPILASADKHERLLRLEGGKGLFTKELDTAILDRKIDLAVHSAKDIPARLDSAIAVSSVLERAAVYDVLVSNKRLKLEQLPSNAVVGTSSIRRELQLKAINPYLTVKPLRGNINSRLQKLSAQKFDAIILAAAALNRLNIATDLYEVLPQIIPALTQGCLAVTYLKESKEITALVSKLQHQHNQALFLAERSLLKHLDGDCFSPIAGLATINKQQIELTCALFDHQTFAMLKHSLAGSLDDPQALGARLAQKMLNNGAAKFLNTAS